MKRMGWNTGILMFLLTAGAAVWWCPPANGNAAGQKKSTFALTRAQTLIGRSRHHTIRTGETLLDVARRYGLGYNEIERLHPSIDPWLPTVGTQVTIPSLWILPDAERTGIVINVAEMRLFFFPKDNLRVTTFPIGIGEKDAATPVGTFTIGTKKDHPVWRVPPSLRHKYDFKWLPPGPDNPLGDFWLGLSETRYGIHGTDTPWSIGRLVTHGCIRLYPEDIACLYGQVPVGTPVRLVYQPVKLGLSGQRIFAEVHPDVYGLIGDLVSFGFAQLHARGLVRGVDPQKMYRVLRQQNGLPEDVTREAPLQALEDGMPALSGTP